MGIPIHMLFFHDFFSQHFLHLDFFPKMHSNKKVKFSDYLLNIVFTNLLITLRHYYCAKLISLTTLIRTFFSRFFFYLKVLKFQRNQTLDLIQRR